MNNSYKKLELIRIALQLNHNGDIDSLITIYEKLYKLLNE